MRSSFALLGMVVMAGCGMPPSEDAIPDDPMRTMKTKMVAPIPDSAMASRSGQSLERLEQGHAVFVSKCIECHEPRIPVDPNNPNWHMTMRGMVWNAELGAADERDLIDYLKAASNE